MVRSFLGVCALVLAQACVITPVQGQLVGRTSPFNVTGYTDAPSSTVVIEAKNWTTGGWEQIGVTTSNSTPTYGAAYWSYNSPAMYFYAANVKVADAAIPATDQRWTPVGGGGTSRDANLRFRNTTTGTQLYAGEGTSPSCFFNTITPTSSFGNTAYNCGWDSTVLWVYTLN